MDRVRWGHRMIVKTSFRGLEKMVSDHNLDLYIEKLRDTAKRQ
jgi:hypothetical protein